MTNEMKHRIFEELHRLAHEAYEAWKVTDWGTKEGEESFNEYKRLSDMESAMFWEVYEVDDD